MAKNILIDGRWLLSGRRGIGIFTYSLLNSLSKIIDNKLRVTVAIPRNCKREFQNEFGDVFSIITHPNLPHPFLDFIYFSYYLLFHKFDLIHFTGNAGMLIFGNNCKVLLTIHDVSFMKPANIVPWPRKFRQIIGRIYRRLVVPICAKKADRIVTVSKFAAHDLYAELGLRYEPSFIYHGVNKNLKISDSFDTEKIAGGSGEYLVIGGVDPQKNIECVVRAFTLIYEKLSCQAPTVSIVGLTQGDYHKYVSHDLVAPNVHFLGYVGYQDVQQIIKASKCLIIPSFYESFGLPLIEAIKNDKPVIASDRGALSEIGNEVPIYFDPYSVSSLVNAIEQSSCIDRSEQIKLWNADNSEKFSWQNCAERYVQIYVEMLSVQ